MSIKYSSVQNAIQQLKLVIPGALITYYLGTFHEFLPIVEGEGGAWGRTVAIGALGHGLLTISLFIYILLMPWLKGIEPDYRLWRQSGFLSSVIPTLTASIVIGWFLAVLTLGQWSSLGYIKGTVGVCAMYSLVFGLLGLLPVPRLKRK